MDRSAKIHEICLRLEALMLRNPSLRLGQLLENIYSHENCIYNMSDTALIEGLEDGYHRIRPI